MRERPIIFSDEMVRAILDGRKTQTRRAIKPQPVGAPPHISLHNLEDFGGYGFSDEDRDFRCPYGRPGDRLWVRETFAVYGILHTGWGGGSRTVEWTWPLAKWRDPFTEIDYRASWCGREAPRWRSPLYMPRWASRIALEIVGIKAERVHDISEEDAIAEGCPHCETCFDPPYGMRGGIESPLNNAMGGRPWLTCPGICEGETARYWFTKFWDSINAKRGLSWLSNPWVWVIDFKQIDPTRP